MKRFFILNFCFVFSSALFPADTPIKLKKKSYIYLINPFQPPTQENTYIASDGLTFLTIDPHIIFTYLRNQDCRIQLYCTIHYYKIPFRAVKKVPASYCENKVSTPCDWNTYRENKYLTQAQKDYLFFDIGKSFASMATQDTNQEDLLKSFRKIHIPQKIMTLRKHPLLDWKTGTEVKTTSL